MRRKERDALRRGLSLDFALLAFMQNVAKKSRNLAGAKGTKGVL